MVVRQPTTVAHDERLTSLIFYFRVYIIFTQESGEDRVEGKGEMQNTTMVFEQSYFTGSHPSKF